jgi:MFS family permease
VDGAHLKLLLLLLPTGIGGAFYLGYSWLPSFFVTHAGISQMTSLWMVLTSMVLFTFIVPVAGYLSDKGQPRVTATIVICAIAGATSVPMFLAFKTGSLAACWLLQAFSLAMTAYTMGILPQICSLIYPAGVRISGFNLGYNLGELPCTLESQIYCGLHHCLCSMLCGCMCAVRVVACIYA